MTAAVRDNETVIFGENGEFLVAAGLIESFNGFLVIHIRQPFEKQDR